MKKPLHALEGTASPALCLQRSDRYQCGCPGRDVLQHMWCDRIDLGSTHAFMHMQIKSQRCDGWSCCGSVKICVLTRVNATTCVQCHISLVSTVYTSLLSQCIRPFSSTIDIRTGTCRTTCGVSIHQSSDGGYMSRCTRTRRHWVCTSRVTTQLSGQSTLCKPYLWHMNAIGQIPGHWQRGAAATRACMKQ